MTITFPTKPEPRAIDPASAAILIVDMQNAFASKGSMFDLSTRYSGFYGTPLDSMLRTRGIRTLLFAGIATNVCVESTLRDAFFLDYWPVLLPDAAMPAGPAMFEEATVRNVEEYFGWTLTASEYVHTVNQHLLREARV